MQRNFRIGAGLTLIALAGCWIPNDPINPAAVYAAARADKVRTAAEMDEDQRITALIRSHFRSDPEVAGLEIDVVTFRSAVTLRGFVTTAREAERAVELAQNAAGVKSVKPSLLLK